MQDDGETNIRSLFERHAQKQPSAVALVTEQHTLTYYELNAAASQLAGRLSHSVHAGERVAFCFDDNPAGIMTAILATLKVGAAYVPIDPRNPEERIAYFLEAANPVCVIGDGTHAEFFASYKPYVRYDTPSNPLPEGSEHRLTGDEPAYVIFTSGSTGLPKGVVVTHANLLGAYHAWESAYDLPSMNCHMQVAGCAFDVFSGDWIRALCSGARLVMCSEQTLNSPESLYHVIEKEGVQCVEFLPTLLRSLVQYMEHAGRHFTTMKLLVCGSDAWYVDEYFKFKALLPTSARLINSYGTSETSIDTSYFEFTNENESLRAECTHVPIGKPFPGMKMLLLNEEGGSSAVHEVGELFIGGCGVSQGYLNAPELNQAKFVTLPGQSGVYFRTGDYAKMLSTGDIEFLGRNDTQIKINGRRIDLSEIESALLKSDLVANAAVLPVTEGSSQVLTAFVALQEGGGIDMRKRLQSELSESLPPHAIPTQYVFLPELPTNLSGKIDRKALVAHHAVYEEARRVS